MKKAEERRNKIISILHDNPEKTQEEISTELGVSLSTIKIDYKELKKQGYKMNSLKGRTAIKNLPADKYVISSTEKAIKAILFLCGLTEGEKSLDEISEGEYDEYIASRSTLFRSIKPYLEDNGLLKKENGRITPSGIYMTSFPKDFSEVLSFAAHCLSKKEMGGEEIYEQALRYLYGKNMFLSSKHDYMLGRFPFYIQKLKKNGADKEPVSFVYKGKKIHFFYLGFVAYSSDKDIIYLIGRTKPTKMDYRVLKADEINWDTVERTYDKNFSDAISDRQKNIRNKMKCFFRKLQAEMFDIVEDSLQQVTVRIKYSVEADNELKQLYESRRLQWDKFDREMLGIKVDEKDREHTFPSLKYINAQGEVVNMRNPGCVIKYIEYSDHIRGVSKFANYLRRFGDTVKVIRNEKIKATIMNGALRALEHYKGGE